VDVRRLAGDLQFEVDDLLPLVDAAALLGLARVDQADAILTPEGEAFAKASVLERKERFHRILMERPTLVSRIHTALMAKKDHRLPEDFFLDLLEKHFSAEEARRQLGTGIQLGRYADLVGFEDDTDELFLGTSEPRSA
jgi:NitT/TauT family transport system ATP-binding protein